MPTPRRAIPLRHTDVTDRLVAGMQLPTTRRTNGSLLDSLSDIRIIRHRLVSIRLNVMTGMQRYCRSRRSRPQLNRCGAGPLFTFDHRCSPPAATMNRERREQGLRTQRNQLQQQLDMAAQREALLESRVRSPFSHSFTHSLSHVSISSARSRSRSLSFSLLPSPSLSRSC